MSGSCTFLSQAQIAVTEITLTAGEWARPQQEKQREREKGGGGSEKDKTGSRLLLHHLLLFVS